MTRSKDQPFPGKARVLSGQAQVYSGKAQVYSELAQKCLGSESLCVDQFPDEATVESG